MIERPGDVPTIEELSVYMNTPKSELYNLVREGKVQCQKNCRQWHFRKEAIGRWLEDLLVAFALAKSSMKNNTTNWKDTRIWTQLRCVRHIYLANAIGKRIMASDGPS